MRHEGTGESSTNTYYSASSTNFAAAPQYIFTYFPEFQYTRFNRQLDYENNKYVFRENKFSTYNERTHYTPWWFPDNVSYEIVVRSDFAYTPSGRLRVNSVSDGIMIEGNRQIVKSSATLFRNKLNRRKPTKAFSGAIVDK